MSASCWISMNYFQCDLWAWDQTGQQKRGRKICDGWENCNKSLQSWRCEVDMIQTCHFILVRKLVGWMRNRTCLSTGTFFFFLKQTMRWILWRKKGVSQYHLICHSCRAKKNVLLQLFWNQTAARNSYRSLEDLCLHLWIAISASTYITCTAVCLQHCCLVSVLEKIQL